MIDRALLNDGLAGSSWANLGLWSDATPDYPAACQALAVRLGQSARLGPGCSVLDVGFGYGDQLQVWKQQFGVGRITGVETDAAAVTAARSKLAAHTDVQLQRGDGRLDRTPERYDRVLALDCAYHFAPRTAFFAHAAQTLQADGVLALTDLVLADTGGSTQTALLARLCGIPRENLMTQAAYEKQLQELGFDNVRFEDLTDAVLGGFSRFVTQLLRQRGAALATAGGAKILATAALCAWLRRGQRVRYVLVSAELSAMRRAAFKPDVAALSSSGTPGAA